ncbi:MAG: ribonuclease III [Acidobacteriota bacterium]|nr:ribonuclease III [Acidobacteriota bacterium]
MKQISLDTLEEALGYRFQRRELLQRALTHSSYAREHASAGGDNEQLEFLGDAVLQMVASQELVLRFPESQEGHLSKLRAHLVNARHLVQCATSLSLGSYLRLGHGEEKTGGRRKTALLADAVEAVLAALYLDGGYETARRVVVTYILDPELERLAGAHDQVLVDDHKSRLQQTLRAQGRPEPSYELESERGPAHDRTFVMKVIVCDGEGNEDFTCTASGATKKAASQTAAEKALERLEEPARG